MKIKLFLNDEDGKDVRDFVKQLMQNPKVGNATESGGLEVKIEEVTDKNVLFIVSRMVAFVTVKKAKERK